MAPKERLAHEDLDPSVDERRTDEQWIEEIERRARRALAGEPGITWTDARKHLERRFHCVIKASAPPAYAD